jgi:hypothetical protein
MPDTLDAETREGQAPFDWRVVLPVHKACAALPELSRAELLALGNDIKASGMRVPILVHADGDADPEFKLLDGRSRLDAMVAVGIEFKFERGHCKEHGAWLHLNITSDIPIALPDGNTQTARGFSEEEIKALVASLNVHRRHLTADQKRNAIDALLKLDPGKSDRQIAAQIGSSPSTVGARRKKGEAEGDVSKLDTRTDSQGRDQPAHKPAKPRTQEQRDAEIQAMRTEVAAHKKSTPADDAATSGEKRKAAYVAAEEKQKDDDIQVNPLIRAWNAATDEQRAEFEKYISEQKKHQQLAKALIAVADPHKNLNPVQIGKYLDLLSADLFLRSWTHAPNLSAAVQQFIDTKLLATSTLTQTSLIKNGTGQMSPEAVRLAADRAEKRSKRTAAAEHVA